MRITLLKVIERRDLYASIKEYIKAKHVQSIKYKIPFQASGTRTVDMFFLQRILSLRDVTNE